MACSKELPELNVKGQGLQEQNEELQKKIDRNGQKLSEFLGDKKYMVGDNVVFSDFSLFELIDNMNFMSEG